MICRRSLGVLDRRHQQLGDGLVVEVLLGLVDHERHVLAVDEQVEKQEQRAALAG
jgi:hypothetical protein